MVPWHEKYMTIKHIRATTAKRIRIKYRIKDFDTISSAFNEAYVDTMKVFDPARCKKPMSVFLGFVYRRTLTQLYKDRVLMQRDILCQDQILRKLYTLRRANYADIDNVEHLLYAENNAELELENQEIVAKLLDLLTKKQRDVIIRWLSGWSITDIAIVLNELTQTISARYQRALKRMRRYCERKGITYDLS